MDNLENELNELNDTIHNLVVNKSISFCDTDAFDRQMIYENEIKLNIESFNRLTTPDFNK